MLNKSEARVLRQIETLLQRDGDGHRVMAQTVLGEVLRPKSDDKRRWAQANASINSKRLDFLVINRWGVPVVGVEYHGSGDYHEDSFMRDAVKREAGIPLIELHQDFAPEDLQRLLIAQIGGGAERQEDQTQTPA